MTVQRSESITNLLTALSALQGEAQDIVKNSEGHHYEYADLTAVLELVRPLCSKHGLAISQLTINTPEMAMNNVVGLETILGHKSGEFIGSALYLPLEKIMKMAVAQTAGTAITYMRRYAICAILNITQKDDDAVNGGEVEAKPKGKAKEKPKDKDLPANYDTLRNIIIEKRLARSAYQPFMDKFGVENFSDLNELQINEMINALGEPA